jgi:hypothetical protein
MNSQTDTAPTTTMPMTQTARREHNKALALALAALKIYVFPSTGKAPLIKGWQKADDSLTDAQSAMMASDFEADHGHAPAHVGATISGAVIDRLWRQFPDAVPSISCGPSPYDCWA